MLKQGLKRYPIVKKDLLQAWDSADELILEHLAGIGLQGKRIVVLNDAFGAISCSLAHSSESADLTVYTDSYGSAKGIELNSQGKLQAVNDLGALQGTYDLAIIRVPKNLSFLEDLLARLSHHLAAGSKAVCGYMVKHQAKGAFDLLEKYVGKTTTSLAKKKARLIFADFERKPAESPYPLRVKIDGFDTPMTNHSNLFSREKLDVGTRFFLEHIPEGVKGAILDLGCGNGIVGVVAQEASPEARLIYSDDSAMAVASARINHASYHKTPAEFLWTHCYENREPESLDLVLCNPPFHQGTTLGDFIARQMFADAHRSLKKGGRIRVIGNTHLQYHVLLKRIFGNGEIVAKNAKFLIAEAVK